MHKPVLNSLVANLAPKIVTVEKDSGASVIRKTVSAGTVVESKTQTVVKKDRRVIRQLVSARIFPAVSMQTAPMIVTVTSV